MAEYRASFPFPAADYAEDRFDINQFLIRNKTSTFFVSGGQSMAGAQIFDGDIFSF